MRAHQIVLWATLGGLLNVALSQNADLILMKRQDSTSETGFPSLTTNTPASATSDPTSNAAATTSTVPSSNGSSTAARTSSTLSAEEPSSTASGTSASISVSSSATSSAPNATSTGAAAQEPTQDVDKLPLEPRITPALGIAGVFLILLGGVYALIGVKNRWLQIFLSSGFLASIATTALVDYVMKPPVSDAIQGGFFVAIVMTGVVFGAGALVFKEFTEGLGCLLGGFTFSMWLLTLRPGGIIESQEGKGAFIGIFCFTAWALSFTSYTRPYALIGSTSFSGATAFTLGIDCFTRAGMKEFWFYLWELNSDLFPLETNTYPLTRGMRVEIALIVIGTIIGVLSQIKLWKVIRSKEKVTEAEREEDARQHGAIEAALGRHLQRQNDREKSQWEREHGDRLQSKRNTVMWKHAQIDPRYSSISVVEVSGERSEAPPARDLEMNALGPDRNRSSYRVKSKHRSTATIDIIEEVEEDTRAVAETERQRALHALEQDGQSTAIRNQYRKSHAQSTISDVPVDPENSAAPREHDIHEKNSTTIRRKSQQSLKRLTTHLNPPYATDTASASQEQLVDQDRPLSRASSAAATMDEENETLLAASLDDEDEEKMRSPEIVVSPPGSTEGEDQKGQDVAGRLGAVSEKSFDLTASSSQVEDVVGMSDSSKKSGTQTQPSDVSDSSAEILTADALAHVPTQISNVVMSYRTNEWAKHIAEADIPLCEEPETTESNSDEAPTHLAQTQLADDGSAEKERPMIEVPPATPLPSTVTAGGSGVGIATHPAMNQRSFSDSDQRRSAAKTPSRPNSMQSLKLPGHRSSRTNFNQGSTTSLIATPIDENVPTEFTAPKTSNRPTSKSPNLVPKRHSSAGSLPLSNLGRPQSAQTGSYSRLSGIYDPSQYRTLSQETLLSSIVPGVRMDSYNRHPSQKNTQNEAERRQSLLADWRLSQQHRASSTSLTSNAVDHSRAQMRAEKENQKLLQEYTQNARQQKQLAIDQVMRRPDMQDLHREAMRKMQAGANEKLRSATG